jgi:hypothetical protein
MYRGSGKCPSCGYLLTAADHRALGTDSSQPKLIRAVAAILLVLIVLGLLLTGFRLF